MTTHSAQTVIRAPLHTVRQILLEPSALPDWNPAFLSVNAPHTATAGPRYPLRTRGALRGFLEYRHITDTRITAHWEVPGLTEDHTWQLHPDSNHTHTTHTLHHHGTLATLLRPAFTNAPALRLDRLAQRAENRTAAPAA